MRHFLDQKYHFATVCSIVSFMLDDAFPNEIASKDESKLSLTSVLSATDAMQLSRTNIRKRGILSIEYSKLRSCLSISCQKYHARCPCLSCHVVVFVSWYSWFDSLVTMARVQQWPCTSWVRFLSDLSMYSSGWLCKKDFKVEFRQTSKSFLWSFVSKQRLFLYQPLVSRKAEIHQAFVKNVHNTKDLRYRT